MIYKKPTVIADIGANHMGDFDIAKQMISVLKTFSEIPVVKFQKRTPKELLTKKEYNAPHPHPYNSFGSTYGKHREFLEFTIEQHKELKKYCEEIGIEYACSVWDVTSAKGIISLNPKTIKVPSACNLNFEMLEVICKTFPGEIHLSLGMTTREEEKEIIELFVKYDRNKDLILYACTSAYPASFDDTALLEIKRLREEYWTVIKDVGFSGHHLGFSIDIAAYTLGANFIERHFTLDRTWKGTDHAASLEPDAFRRLARDLEATQRALHLKEGIILQAEEDQREKLKRLSPWMRKKF